MMNSTLEICQNYPHDCLLIYGFKNGKSVIFVEITHRWKSCLGTNRLVCFFTGCVSLSWSLLVFNGVDSDSNSIHLLIQSLEVTKFGTLLSCPCGVLFFTFSMLWINSEVLHLSVFSLFYSIWGDLCCLPSRFPDCYFYSFTALFKSVSVWKTAITVEADYCCFFLLLFFWFLRFTMVLFSLFSFCLTLGCCLCAEVSMP